MSNVIEIGKVRVSRITKPICEHIHLNYDRYNKTIQCGDCDAFIDPFTAFLSIAEKLEKANERIRRGQRELDEAKQKDIHLLAARKVEDAWRSKTMVPICPHCNEAIFPEDGLGGARISKKMAIERRKFKQVKRDN